MSHRSRFLAISEPGLERLVRISDSARHEGGTVYAGSTRLRWLSAAVSKRFFSALADVGRSIRPHGCNLIVSLGAAGLHCAETTRTVLPVNSLFVIAPYKYEGIWVFDDPRVELSREPFIAGIDTMIDWIVAGIPGAEQGFRAIFSAAPFPGYTEKLDWCREESGGNWYYNDHFKMEGWLCPALLKYFETAPKTIYVLAEPKI